MDVNEVGVDPHRDLVSFLQDQETLDTHPAQARIGKSDVFPLVVMTKKNNIVIGDHSRIDDLTKLEGGQGVVIGNYVHIASLCHVNVGGGLTTIEDGAAMASGAKIITGGNQPDSISCSAVAPIEQQVLGTGSVRLEKNSILYADAMVYAGPGKHIVIGEGSRVVAKSLVLKSIPPGEIWGGVPAKFMRHVQKVKP